MEFEAQSGSKEALVMLSSDLWVDKPSFMVYEYPS